MDSPEVSCLLDTDVLIDVWRGVREAQEWLQRSRPELFYIPGMVAMELVCGCRSGKDLDRCLAFTKQFTILWHSEAEGSLAFEYLVRYQLANGLGSADAMIAAMAQSRSFRLYTCNLRHFRCIPDLDVRIPYLKPTAPGS